MRIVGWRVGAKKIDATKAITKHTNTNLRDAKKMIDDALEGIQIELDSDFVLQEDLEDAGFIIR